MSVLAIDYGRRKIGLAISSGSLASPLPILKFKKPEYATNQLINICRENDVKLIIFGLPDPDRIGAKEFGRRLSKISKIPIEFVDETMTTQIASERLINLKKKKAEDSLAAAILLEEYLEEKEKNIG